jgi:hypothetical protein
MDRTACTRGALYLLLYPACTYKSRRENKMQFDVQYFSHLQSLLSLVISFELSSTSLRFSWTCSTFPYMCSLPITYTFYYLEPYVVMLLRASQGFTELQLGLCPYFISSMCRWALCFFIQGRPSNTGYLKSITQSFSLSSYNLFQSIHYKETYIY